MPSSGGGGGGGGFLSSLLSSFVLPALVIVLTSIASAVPFLPLLQFLLDKKADREWKSFNKRWAESDPFKVTMTRACFARVLRDKLLFKEFEAFAETSHFAENLHFFTAIAGLEKELQPLFPNYRTALTRFLAQTQSLASEPPAPIPENLIAHYLYIHACFLTADCANDLNLSGGVRARAQAVCLQGATIDVFDEAADEVFSMLYFEGFRRFVEESNNPIRASPRVRKSADDVFSSMRRPTPASSIASRRTAVGTARSKLRAAFAKLAPAPPLPPPARPDAMSLFAPQKPPVAVAATTPNTPPRLKLERLSTAENGLLTPPPTPPPRRVVPPCPPLPAKDLLMPVKEQPPTAV
ncbi:hypothetical protein HDU86_001578 [Geranomyces michiganensis]|nr:hypothetical protein HDU86_001578 [Geranomyces michiganensis]